MGLGYQVSFDALSLNFEGRLLLSLLGSKAPVVIAWEQCLSHSPAGQAPTLLFRFVGARRTIDAIGGYS